MSKFPLLADSVRTKPKGALKFDGGKSPVVRGVLWKFPRAILALAGVSEFGAAKYGVPIEATDVYAMDDCEGRLIDAAGRHLIKSAPDYDGHYNPEDGDLMHYLQVAWGALGAAERVLRDREEYDRLHPTLVVEPPSDVEQG